MVYVGSKEQKRNFAPVSTVERILAGEKAVIVHFIGWRTRKQQTGILRDVRNIIHACGLYHV